MAQRRLPLRFTIPGNFVELPLDAIPAERVRDTYQRVSAGMPAATDAQRIHLVFMQEFLLSKMIRGGAVYAAVCVCKSETHPGKLSTAQFAIFSKEVALRGDRPLAAVAGGLKEPGQPRETEFARFPAGEGVVVGEQLRVDFSHAIGQQKTGRHIIRQAQVLLPSPDNKHLVVLSMSSESIEDWHFYASMLNDIAHSVSFTEENKSISDRLTGAL